MKKLLYLGLLSVCVLLGSYVEKNVSNVFDKVERYMDVYPDSALLLLEQIPHPEELRGKQRADYALLLTQARDKNYLDSLQSDSLIKIAVDYYKDDGVKAGKALFYYGKVAALQDNDTLAIQAYLSALAKLEKTEEYKMMALVHQYVGRLNDDSEMYDMALDNYRKSIFYNKKVGDTLKMVYSYRNIAWIYEVRKEYVNAARYAKMGMSLLKQDSLSPVYSSLAHFLGEQEKRQGNYVKAVEFFHSALKNEQVSTLIPYYNLSLGDAYLQLGQLERAEMYVRNALSSEDCYTQSGAYHYLYLLEKKRAEYAKALLYKEKSDSLQKIAQEMNLQHKIFEIQQKNEADKLVVENKLLMQEKQIQLYFWLLLSLSFIVVGFVAYQEIKKQYRKSYRKRLKRFMEKELKTYQENEKIIEQYICQIEELKKCNQQAQKGMLSEVLVKEQIGILAQKIQVLKNENKEIREHSQQGALFLLGQLKEGNLNVKKLSEEEWLNIFGYIDLLSGNFVTNLRQKYKLNEHNLMLAVLIKLGFSTAELVAAFVCEENSIFKKKQRLKEKLHLGKQDDLNAFFKTNPLYLSIQKNKL